MKWLSILVTLVSALFAFAVNLSAQQQAEYDDFHYLQILAQFLALPEQSPVQVAEVSNFSFQRDVGQFELKNGTLALLPDIAGSKAVMVFRGDGVFGFEPPLEVEKGQLKRFFDNQSALRKPFDFLFMVFADQTWREFNENLVFTPTADAQPNSEIKYCLEFLSDRDAGYFQPSIMNALLNQVENELFYAQINIQDNGPLFWMIDPYEVEEIRLLRKADHNKLFAEVICQFNKQGDLTAGTDWAHETKTDFDIEHYQIESSIAGNLDLDFSASATLTLRNLPPEQRWLHFELFHALDVDSVFWENRQSGNFVKGKNSAHLWVENAAPQANSETRTLQISYHGDLLSRNESSGDIYIHSISHWYPRLGSRKAATFDLTYHTPKKYSAFASVGNKISESRNGDVVTSRWQVQRPANYVSFNLGNYDAYQVKNDKAPPITVYGYKGSVYLEDVGDEIANSAVLFNDIFGDYPFEQLTATATAYEHGIAFPGFLHLAASTFRAKHSEGYDDIFRAHETAHQWWGIAVDFASYHDQWLSEAMSTFAGLKYMQTVRFEKGGTEKYFKVLDEWREQIFSNRKYVLGSGKESGPIWLGYRTGSSETAGDYSLIIYRKGAWVLHMLRMMLIDTQNLANEKKFNDLLRTFYNNYRGKKASTADFQKVAEQYAGMQLDWFFEQWIYGTDMPEYKFAYQVAETDDGKYRILCRVTQNEVAPGFRMPVLLQVDFGDNRFFTTRKIVTGRVSEIDLGMAPLKPQKVIFNALSSVLAKVEEEAW